MAVHGCTTNKKQHQETNIEYIFNKQSHVINPKVLGIWKSIGNGYYLEAKQDSVRLYSYTENFCYKEKNDYLEGLLNTESQFFRKDDTISIYLTDFGEKTKELQVRKDFVKIKELPKNCLSFSEMQNLNNPTLFRLYVETLKENYGFQQERRLNFKSLYENYKDSIDVNPSSLFKAMGAIATHTKDQHTKVISVQGQSLQYRVTPSAETVKQAFNEQSIEKGLDVFFSKFFNSNYQNISDSLLRGNGQKALNGKLEWGSLTDDIGYLNIHSFTGFLSNEFTRRQQLDSLNHYMQRIIKSFEKKKALILDISFNFGGYDAAGLTIASYFTNTPISTYTSQVFNKGSYYDEGEVLIYPAKSTVFTKPVYVVMTDISRSAAESFAMIMGALPQVKLVGTRTLGTLSGMLGKSIGEYYTTCSNQRLLMPKGKHYEVSGVEPDIELKVFYKDDIFDSHMKAVREVIKMAEQD